jgi:hypothetical protein
VSSNKKPTFNKDESERCDNNESFEKILREAMRRASYRSEGYVVKNTPSNLFGKKF